MKSIFKFTFIFILATQTLGCAVAVFSGAAATTAAVSADRRDLDTQLLDHEIEQSIARAIDNEASLFEQAHVNVVSYNRNVLLVGQATSEYVRNKILDIAGQNTDLKDIYNEITIEKPTSTAQRAKDAWLTTKVKTRMLADKELDGHQVKVFTENQQVFLMGLLTKREKKIAVTIARNMDGVDRVIDVIETNEQYANER
ncbi:transport-associated protein [Catenovulum agarivorans DS-2]|uniref:Transport-associated protein n=1 Tax=Catenovulum agarivorans DS-2 TaxID=1328313 RepID=W7QCL0_9ALTE|nr:BON domain-containing protein [Catenovulum agarivorans]EWH10629.1 transport-associated protein [Catenovulum agarivorans DS-2]